MTGNTTSGMHKGIADMTCETWGNPAVAQSVDAMAQVTGLKVFHIPMAEPCLPAIEKLKSLAKPPEVIWLAGSWMGGVFRMGDKFSAQEQSVGVGYQVVKLIGSKFVTVIMALEAFAPPR